jgi:hypothetical protein
MRAFVFGASQSNYVRRISLMTMFLAAMLAFSATNVRAETVTLNCTGGVDGIFVVDLSAKTAALKSRAGDPYKLINVQISDSAFSFILDLPPAQRMTYNVDRTTGSIRVENYFYPQGGVRGAPNGVGQCAKIPNKAF